MRDASRRREASVLSLLASVESFFVDGPVVGPCGEGRTSTQAQMRALVHGGNGLQRVALLMRLEN